METTAQQQTRTSVNDYILNFNLSQKRLVYSCIDDDMSVDELGDMFIPKLGIVLGEFCVSSVINATKRP